MDPTRKNNDKFILMEEITPFQRVIKKKTQKSLIMSR